MAVGQTLVAITTNVTPITTPLTNAAGLVFENLLTSNMAALENLAVPQLRVISLLGLIYTEAGLGSSADYKVQHAQLNQDAQVLLKGISLVGITMNKNRALIEAASDWNFGFNVDPTISTSVNTLLKEGRDFLAMSEEAVERMIILLRIALG